MDELEARGGEADHACRDPRGGDGERAEDRREPRDHPDGRLLHLRRGLEEPGGEADEERGAEGRGRDDERDEQGLAADVEESGIHG